jgi:hypothetical protein
MCQDLEMTNKHLKLELSRVAALTDEVLTYAMSVYAHYTHSLCPIMHTLYSSLFSVTALVVGVRAY